jgi:hypothetical protein
MADERVRQTAQALRAALGQVAPSYNSFSDADVIREAMKDPLLDPENKRQLAEQFGDTALTSFAKGVGRGVGLDLLAGGVDSLLGTNTQSYLNDDVLADNVGASIGGNIVGTVAGMAIPGGALLKGGRLAKAGLGALGAYNASSQGYGQQAQERAHGEREDLYLPSIALQGAVGGVGGRALPKVLSIQQGIRSAPGGLSRARNLSRYVGVGAAAGALEGAGEGAFSTLGNETTLHPSAQESAPGMMTGALVGGAAGTLLGGAADLVDARLHSRVTSPKAARHMPAPAPPSAPPPEARLGNEVPPVLQTPQYDPSRLANVSTKLADEYIASPDYQRGVIAGTAAANENVVRKSFQEALSQLTSGRTTEEIVDRSTGKALPIVYLKEAKQFLVMDPEDGAIKQVPRDVLTGGRYDRVTIRKKIKYGYPGEHRAMPKAASLPVTRGNEAYLPISFAPDFSSVGVVPADPSLIKGGGRINPVELLPLDESFLQGDRNLPEALKLALEMIEKEKAAAKVARRPTTLEDSPTVDPQAADQWRQSIPEGFRQVRREMRPRPPRGVRQ